MAIYSPLHKTFWSDPDMRKLSPLGRYLFLYFFSGPSVLPSGVYEISIDKIAFDTGVPDEEIRELLLNGTMANISYDEKTETIFVHNKLRYSPGGRKSLLQLSVNNQFKRSSQNPLWKIFNRLYPSYIEGFSNCCPTDGQQMDNSYPTDGQQLEEKPSPTPIKQVKIDPITAPSKEPTNSWTTVEQQMDNSCATDGQLFNTNTNTNTKVLSNTKQSLPPPLPITGKGSTNKKSAPGRGKRFKEIFAAYPGRKESQSFCQTRFMAQIKNADDLAEFERVYEKYLNAHKARKLSDMSRVRWMKSTEFFDGGWLKVADPDWLLGKKEPTEFKIVKSAEEIQKEKVFWIEQARKAFDKQDPKFMVEILEDIQDFLREFPSVATVLPSDLKIQIDTFLTQQEA